MTLNQIRKKLLLYYAILSGLLLSVVVLLALTEKQLGLPFEVNQPKIWSLIIALAGVSSGLIAPMWIRILLFRRRGNISSQSFFFWQMACISMAALAFTFTIIAFVININAWARYLTTFVAFYAIYQNFPSLKKLTYDASIFKVSFEK